MKKILVFSFTSITLGLYQNMLIFVDLKFFQVDVLLSYVHYFNIRPKCVSR